MAQQICLPMIQAMARQGSCESGLTYIDGEKGVLLHRGYPIEQLAEQSDFLEVAYLLLNGELPNAEKKLNLTHLLRITQWFMNSFQISIVVLDVMRTQWLFYVVLQARYLLFTMI